MAYTHERAHHSIDRARLEISAKTGSMQQTEACSFAQLLLLPRRIIIILPLKRT
jgi:hypothetical protein